MMKLLFVAILLFTQNAFADYLDDELDAYVQRFRFKPVAKPVGRIETLYKLGESLFNDKKVSGNNNVSCASCHAKDYFSTDMIPLSIGVNGTHDGDNSSTNHIAPIIARNSPHLFNLGEPEHTLMFWDGRVSYNPNTHTFFTPEPGLNTKTPKFKKITQALSGALAAQVIFPPLSFDEMRGQNNPIASAKDNFTAWSKIMKKLKAIKKYQNMFNKAYPKVADHNIGHFGSALAHYIKFQFSVTDTPWDEYLRGDKSALSEEEKKGAIAFSTSGRCVICHAGKHLGGDNFFNVASPQIGPGKTIDHDDMGLYHTTKNERHKYMFKTPSLRNTALTAPYFHSGALQTLEDVIDHYNGGMNSIDSYDDTWLKIVEDKNYLTKLYVEKDQEKLNLKKQTVHPVLRRNFISLNATERKNLLLFLKKSLTSKSYLKN